MKLVEIYFCQMKLFYFTQFFLFVSVYLAATILQIIFLLTAGAIAGIVLTVIAVLAALIYFRNPEKRACFRSWINLLSFRRGAGRVEYCRVRSFPSIFLWAFMSCRVYFTFLSSQVDTTEEARLLFDASDPTQCQTDSDDDLLHA